MQNSERESKIFCSFLLKTGGKIYMEHKLVIAEKPSVAVSIVKIIGANNKKDATMREMVRIK